MAFAGGGGGGIALVQGRAGKIQGPVRNSKMGPYLVKKIELMNYNNVYIIISYIAISIIRIIPIQLPVA